MTHFLTLACTYLFDQPAAASADNMPGWLMAVCGVILCVFLGLLGLLILWYIWTGKINLSSLLSEANGDASMSRFQLLIFTFVIAFSLFYLVETGHAFPYIPEGVLTLLGISASTYAVGKGISYSRDEGVMTDAQITEKHEVQAQTAQAQVQTAQAQAVQAQAQAAQAVAQAAAPGQNG